MVAFLTSRSTDAVRAVIEAWLRLLVEGRFGDALAILGRRRSLLEPLETEPSWTPELLAKVIQNYGSVVPRKDGKTFVVTPTDGAAGNGPRFEVTWFEQPIGVGWGACVGYAHYDMPLNGAWSDVTVTFDIVDTQDGLVLALDDVHVM